MVRFGEKGRAMLYLFIFGKIYKSILELNKLPDTLFSNSDRLHISNKQCSNYSL